jgi:hypothetical protein
MKPRDFGLISVGQIHPRSLDTEGAEFTWKADRLELMMTFKNSTPFENQAVESGIFEVGLNVVEHIPFLCFRIFWVEADLNPDQEAQKATLVLPWQECPLHLAQTDSEHLPAFDYVMQNSGFRLPITAVLTDLKTSRVRSFQHFSLSAFMSRYLVESLLTTFPYHTRTSFPISLDRVFAHHPLNSIGDTARIRCRSGE